MSENVFQFIVLSHPVCISGGGGGGEGVINFSVFLGGSIQASSKEGRGHETFVHTTCTGLQWRSQRR